MPPILHIAFWFGGVTLVYTFIGYPMLIHSLGRFRRRAARPPADRPLPRSVSVVLVVRNEADRIAQRLENLAGSELPETDLEIVLVDDGSDDETVQVAQGAGIDNLTVITHPEHRGKPAGLNDGVAAAGGEIIVFADARQRFEATTIPSLIAAFADPETGAVSGELQIEPSSAGAGAGVDAYWRLEKAIRHGESHIDSAIGCTGAVYAILRSAYIALPEDTVLDDVVCPMLIALQGKRVRFCPEAVAFDPQKLDPHNERRRKRRTIAGNFQMLFRYPSWLLPWKNRLFLQLISHKYLRLLAPLLILAVFSLNLAIATGGSRFYQIILAGQGVFFLLALVGLINQRASSRWLTLPAGFVFLNLMTVRGFIEYFRLRGRGGW